MSEAVENNPFRQVGEAFIVARPDRRFSAQLERFYNDISLRQLGGRALELVSDRRLRIFSDPISDETFDTYPDMTSLKRVSAMESDLRRRGQIHPPVLRDVRVAPDYKSVTDKKEKPGLKLHFGVAIDSLTAMALQRSVLLNADGTLPVHLTISRQDMRIGHELPQIRDDLLEALDGTPPLTVENLHITTPNIRI